MGVITDSNINEFAQEGCMYEMQEMLPEALIQYHRVCKLSLFFFLYLFVYI